MAVVKEGDDVVDSSANSGNTTFTVPSAAEVAVLMYHEYGHTAGVPTFDFDGTDSFVAREQQSSDSPAMGLGLYDLVLSSTGSRTFNWDFPGSGTPAYGCTMVLAYLSGVHATTPRRDTAFDTDTGTNAITVTLTSETEDFILASAQKITSHYGTDPGLDGTNFIDARLFNTMYSDASVVTALATSTTINMSNEFYSGMVAAAYRPAPAAASGYLRLPLLGVG